MAVVTVTLSAAVAEAGHERSAGAPASARTSR